MQKIVWMSLFSVLCAACAGEPPAWWNPRQAYSAPQTQQAVSNQPAAKTAPIPLSVQETQEPVSLLDESYEEMVLTPVQDEEGENKTGQASAQSVPGPEELPAPSVLE